MGGTRKVGNLEIGEDLDFQRKEWRFERAGWIAMALLLVLALLGLFGSGPLSAGRAQAGPLAVEYPRFTRYQSQSELRITVDGAQTGGESARVLVSRAYLESFQIEAIIPEPESTQLTQDNVIYEFQTAEAGQPLTITFHLQSEGLGSIEGQVGLEGDAEPARYRTFVYP